MRHLATLLFLPLAILLAVVLIRPPETTGPPPPEPTTPEETIALGSGDRQIAVTDKESARTAPVRTAPERCDPTGEDAESAHARALVFSLRFASESRPPRFPTLEVAEAARLLSRRPETAAVFIEALAGASREFRAVLIHTFLRVEDEVLRSQLQREYNESDPTAGRLREILADREMILATLENHSNADVLHDLLARLGTPLLADHRIREALLVLARSSDDPKIRDRALARVGRLDDPEVRTLLLSILADPTRDISERQTAARTLARRPGPDTTPVFLEIIDRNEPAPLLRFATLGLKTSGTEVEVAEALFKLLLTDSADETARQNAASALSHTVRTSPQDTALPLEERLRSALIDLSRQETSHGVLVHAMGELSRGLDGRFDDDLVGILRVNRGEEFRVLLVADPTLKKFLEAL